MDRNRGDMEMSDGVKEVVYGYEEALELTGD